MAEFTHKEIDELLRRIDKKEISALELRELVPRLIKQLQSLSQQLEDACSKLTTE